MRSDDGVMRRVWELDSEFRRLTGREGFGYVSNPGPNSSRYVFQDGTVVTKPELALSHMQALLSTARANPADLPYPLDEELPPGQDRRGDEAWITERLR